MPQDLFSTLLGRAQPDPNQQPQWTPEGQGMPDNLLIRGTNMLRGAAGLGDPNNRDSQLGGIIGDSAPLVMGMAAAKKGEPLLQMMIDMYKKRIADEPWLVGHPGLSQVPEFKEAFRQLHPNKEIVVEGRKRIPATTRLKQESAPPATGSPDDVATTAQAAPSRVKEAPRSILGGSGVSGNRKWRENAGSLAEDTVRQIKQLGSKGMKPIDIKKQFPAVDQSHISAILRGDSWYWVK